MHSATVFVVSLVAVLKFIMGSVFHLPVASLPRLVEVLAPCVDGLWRHHIGLVPKNDELNIRSVDLRWLEG